MSLIYSNNKDLNKMIDTTLEQETAANFVLNHYKQLNNKYPSESYLKSEYDRYTRWLYKGSHEIKMINSIKLARRYFRIIGVELFIETMEV